MREINFYDKDTKRFRLLPLKVKFNPLFHLFKKQPFEYTTVQRDSFGREKKLSKSIKMISCTNNRDKTIELLTKHKPLDHNSLETNNEYSKHSPSWPASSFTGKKLRSELFIGLKRRLRNRFNENRKSKSYWIKDSCKSKLKIEDDYCLTNAEGKFINGNKMKLPELHNISSKREHLLKSVHKRNKRIVCEGR